MNCADYLVDFLIKHGVTDVFGFAGGYIVPFQDALYKRPEIKVHVCYNEQGCSFAANGYARTSGKLGVYFTTSGPEQKEQCLPHCSFQRILLILTHS